MAVLAGAGLAVGLLSAGTASGGSALAAPAGAGAAAGRAAAAGAAPMGDDTLLAGPRLRGRGRATNGTTPPAAGGTAEVKRGSGKLTPALAALARPATTSSTGGSKAFAQPLLGGLPVNTPGGMQRLRSGAVVVDIRLDAVSAATLAALRAEGADVRASSADLATVTASVPPSRLAAVAALPQVRSVRAVPAPISHSCGALSQADSVLGAGQARTAFGVDGTGQTVGIVSDSFNANLGQADDVAAGALPGPGNPCARPTPVDVAADEAAGSDEGRAMGELVHSLAPGAELAFASAGESQLTMAQHIDDLRTTHGATVLVDDITFIDEPFYQDGPVSAAVNRARAADVPYFSSAANSNIPVGGRDIGSLEALRYQADADCPLDPDQIDFQDCHNFSPTGAASPNDRPFAGFAVPPGSTMVLDLQWAQPWGGVSTDYDLFLVDASGEVVGYGIDQNVDTQVPFEVAAYRNTGGSAVAVYAVVARYAGPQVRFKLSHLGRMGSINAATWTTTTGNNVVGPTIFGHNGAASTYSVAASDWRTPTTPEPYSSHGPVTILFQPVPSLVPVTARVLQKPDFTAVDCVSTAMPDFTPFCGTSAAAPHAAAVAALLKQKRQLTATQIGDLLAGSATPMRGSAAVVGTGLINASSALNALPQPYHPLTPTRITDTRPGSPFPNAGRTLHAGSTLDVQVAGLAGVPAGANAVVLNVTATKVSAPSYLTVWPAGAARPSVSSLNVVRGRTAVNLVQVALGSGGKVSIYNQAGSADVVVDLQGYVGAATSAGAGLYHPVAPTRVSATRALGAQRSTDVRVTGLAGVPATGVSAVVLNVTATKPTASSYLTVWPAGAARPSASNVNVLAGETVPNRVIVPVGDGGSVAVYNAVGTVDVLVDVAGWFTDDSDPAATGARFTALTPRRITDTRAGSGFANAGRTLGAGASLGVRVGGALGGPRSPFVAAMVNVTVTRTTASSYLTVWPSGTTRPVASDLNWTRGRTVTNAVVSGVGTDGALQVFNAAGSGDVIVDLSGWYW